MDQIVGTSILIPADVNDPYDSGYLHYVAQRANGGYFVEWVPVTTESKWKAEDKSWATRVEGDVIHGHPSIDDRGYGWHNAYNWSTKFVVYTPEMSEKYRENNVNRLVKAINPNYFPELK